jgi:4-diphosphocytidyl-2-C-methyl-D-erythritol kinase
MKKKDDKGLTDRLLVVVSAKVNLLLKVLETASSGYHLIETIFHSIDLRDEVFLRKTDVGISLKIEPENHEGVPEGAENIVCLAAERFFETSGLEAGVEIILKKHIPVGAGLGGGSADGAATLRGLNLMFGSPISEPDIYHMAGNLGSDVPFLLYGGSALAWGRGDRMIPLEALPSMQVGLCYPGFQVSSKQAYEMMDESGEICYPGTSFVTFDELSQRNWILSNLQNDFEDIIFTEYPRLKEIKETFLEMGAIGSLLSGSGSSVYGVFEERKKMREALEEIERSFNTDVYESSFVSQGMVIEIPMED